MTEFFGPEGHPPAVEEAPRPASPIAGAQGLHLAEIIPLKIVAGSGAAAIDSGTRRAELGGVYDEAFAMIAGAVLEMAAAKNVPVPPEYGGKLAAILIDSFEPATMRWLVKCEKAAVELIASAINCFLDLHAAVNVMRVVWGIEGFDHLDDGQLYKQAQEWMRPGIANDLPDRRYRWPDMAEMAIAYFRARSGGPVAVKMPSTRAIRAVYSMDTRLCRRTAKGMGVRPDLPNPSSGPQPLIIRWSGLPDMPGGKFPDGRCVKKMPDGGVCTSWWKDGQPHRDPKEGPAWHRKTASGDERTAYFVHGKLHRDPCEGPAIIDTNLDGQEIATEEYYQDDLRHRLATEGPAVRGVDRSGTVVCEHYYEYGKLHRDPKEGPAWRGVGSDGEFTEYYVRGVLHRDPQDGPAWHRKSSSGERVEYIVEGRLHRDLPKVRP